MGFGSNRKLSDLPIRTPRKKGLNKGGASSGGGRTSKDLALCPASLRVKLSKETSLPEGTKLIIVKNDNGIALYFGAVVVGQLGAKKGQFVAFCISKGLKYEASVEKRGNDIYAKVIRMS